MKRWANIHDTFRTDRLKPELQRELRPQPVWKKDWSCDSRPPAHGLTPGRPSQEIKNAGAITWEGETGESQPWTQSGKALGGCWACFFRPLRP